MIIRSKSHFPSVYIYIYIWRIDKISDIFEMNNHRFKVGKHQGQ